jgi:hypothetical protein
MASIKRWLVAQGFTERVAALVIWQALILISVGAYFCVMALSAGMIFNVVAIGVVLLLLFMPTKYHLVDGILIMLMLFFILLALAAQPILTNYK